MWRSTFTELVLGTFLTLVLTGILMEQNRIPLPAAPYYGAVTAMVNTSPSVQGACCGPSGECLSSSTTQGACTGSFFPGMDCGACTIIPPNPCPNGCNDGDVCTEDMCTSGGCYYSEIPDCCRNDDECASDDPCWLTACISDQCFGMYDNACCDDRNACTSDYADSGGGCHHDPINGCGSSSSAPQSSAPGTSSQSSAPSQQQCMNQNHAPACPSGGACLPVGSNPCSQSIPCCDVSGNYVSPSFSCCASAPCRSQTNTCTTPASSSSAPASSSVPPASSSAPGTSSSSPFSSSSSSEELVSCCFDTYCSDDVPAGLCDEFGEPAEDPIFGGGNALCDSDPCGGAASSSPPEPSSSAGYSSSSQPVPSSSAASSSSQPGPSSASESASSQSGPSSANTSSEPNPSSASSSSQPNPSSSSASSGCTEAEKRSCCYDDEQGKHHCENGVCPAECKRRGSSPYPTNDACPPPSLFSYHWFAAWLTGAKSGTEVKYCPVPNTACCRTNCSMKYYDQNDKEQTIPGTYKYCSADSNTESCGAPLAFTKQGTTYTVSCGGGGLQELFECRKNCNSTNQILCCLPDESPPKTTVVFGGQCSSLGGYEVQMNSECKPVFIDCCTDRINGKVVKKSKKDCTSPAFVVTSARECKAETDCAKIQDPTGGTYMGCIWKQTSSECSWPIEGSGNPPIMVNMTPKSISPNPGVCCCPDDTSKNCCRMISTPSGGSYSSSWQCTYEGSQFGNNVACSSPYTIGSTIYHPGRVLPGTAEQCKEKCTGENQESGCCCNLKNGTFAGTTAMWLSYESGFGAPGQSPAETCTSFAGKFTKASGMGGKSCDNTYCEGEQTIACCPPKPTNIAAEWKCTTAKKSEKATKCDANPPKEFSGSMCPTGDAAYCREPEKQVPCCYKTEDTEARRWDCNKTTPSSCKERIRGKQLAAACPTDYAKLKEACEGPEDKVHCCERPSESAAWTCSLKKVSECNDPKNNVSLGKATADTCSADELAKCTKPEDTLACCPLNPDEGGNWNCIDVKKSEEGAKCQKGTTFGQLKCASINPPPTCYKPPERIVACCSTEGTCWQTYLQEGKTCDTKNGINTYYPDVYDPPSKCNTNCPPKKVPCCPKNGGACALLSQTECKSDKIFAGASCPSPSVSKCEEPEKKTACCTVPAPSGGGGSFEATQCSAVSTQTQCQEMGGTTTGDPSEKPCDPNPCEKKLVSCCQKGQNNTWTCGNVEESQCTDPNHKVSACPANPEECGLIACCEKNPDGTLTGTCGLSTSCNPQNDQLPPSKDGKAITSCSPNPCKKQVACCEKNPDGTLTGTCGLAETCNGENDQPALTADGKPATSCSPNPCKTGKKIACCKKNDLIDGQFDCPEKPAEGSCPEGTLKEMDMETCNAKGCPDEEKVACCSRASPSAAWTCQPDIKKTDCPEGDNKKQRSACPANPAECGMVACCEKENKMLTGKCALGSSCENNDDEQPALRPDGSPATECTPGICAPAKMGICCVTEGDASGAKTKCQPDAGVISESQCSARNGDFYEKNLSDSATPCSPNPCAKPVPCCVKENDKWTCKDVEESKCSQKVNKCPAENADPVAYQTAVDATCGVKQVLCCLQDKEGIETGECKTVPADQCMTQRRVKTCEPNPCGPTKVACCTWKENSSPTCREITAKENCDKTKNEKQVKDMKTCQEKGCEPYVVCCAVINGKMTCADLDDPKSDYNQRNWPDFYENLSGMSMEQRKSACLAQRNKGVPSEVRVNQGQCPSACGLPPEKVPCCVQTKEARPQDTGACKLVLADECTHQVDKCSPNPCGEKPEKKVTCIDKPGPWSLATCVACRGEEDSVAQMSPPVSPSPLRAQITAQVSGGGSTGDGWDVLGDEFEGETTEEAKQSCISGGCPVGSVRKACCSPASGTCSVQLLGINEPCTSVTGSVDGPDGRQYDDNVEDTSDCNDYCATFKGVAGSSAGGDQSSAEGETSSSGGGASSEAPEIGNCCVEGDDFGLCFADIDQATCEDSVIGGSFMGGNQCIESPSAGANCGPRDEGDSSSGGGTSSEGHSSSGGETSSESLSSSSSSSTPCGNGTVDEGEECDEGNQNSNTPNAACRLGCKAARCGDGIKDNSPSGGRDKEICDDGDDCSNGHACNSDSGTATCKLNCKNRNTFYTLGQWLQNLKLYAINGTPIPDAPPTNEQTKFIVIGVLTFILQ